MTNDFDGMNRDEAKIALEELLAQAETNQERERLKRAWEKLGPLRNEQIPAPKPSAELERIFSGQADSNTGELMDDDDLDMIAAAGTPIIPPEDES